jgi:hypothetical protein
MLPLKVTVESVERLAPTEDLIANFGIDAPVATGEGEDQFLLIAGWVLGGEGAQIQGVQVSEDGRLLKLAPINVPRADVLEALHRADVASDRIGFYFEVGTVGLADRFALDIEILCGETVEQATLVPVCRVTARKSSSIASESRYRPLLVTALARSGTTLLMGALAQHPEVLVTNIYPYEIGQSNYWLHMLMVASAPADFEGSAHPDEFADTRFHIGHNPYSHPSYVNQYSDRLGARRYYTDSTLRALARFCVERIDEYYDLVARQEGKPDAKLFAEKVVPGFVQNVCRDVYAAPREVLLVRDFRDVFCSAKAFNAKRNELSFGRDRVENDLQWIDVIFEPGARELFRAWQRRKSSVLLVRYEDLIRSPAAELKKLFAHLEVDDDPVEMHRIVDNVSSLTDAAAAHSTAASPGASIGRWRQELAPELQAHFRNGLGDVLDPFGYD